MIIKIDIYNPVHVITGKLGNIHKEQLPESTATH
jgi:hypothetical protein